MKERINRSVLVGVAISLLVLVVCVVVIVIRSNVMMENHSGLAELLGILVDLIIPLLTLAIAASQACQNMRRGTVVFAVNIVAVVACLVAILLQLANVSARELATYLGLFFVLVGMSINTETKTRQSEEENEKSLKRGAKIIAAMLAAAMIIIALASFFMGSPEYKISDGIVYMFILVIILLVWDSVESFSLGNLITLSKKVRDKEKEVEKLSNENQELRAQFWTAMHNKQILNLAINSERGQVESDIQDDSNDKSGKRIGEGSNVEDEKTDVMLETETGESRYGPYRYPLEELVARKAIEKFANKNNISNKELQMNVKFSRDFIERDPIMVRSVSFDAYAERSLDEMFLEVKFLWQLMSHSDQIYYILSQINRYANVNKVNAKLVVIVPKISEESIAIVCRRGTSSVVRGVHFMRDRFALAIKNGLLELAEIEITDEEIAALQSDLGKK